MIIADIISIGINLLLTVLVLVTLLLLTVILMQRPKQEGLGAAFGASMTDQAFGARTTDVLQNATKYLGALYMLLAVGLGMLMSKQYSNEKAEKSALDVAIPIQAPAKVELPKPEEKKPITEMPAPIKALTPEIHVD